MRTTSCYLNQRQLNTVSRIGNILVPAGNGFPAFSESGCLYNIDVMLAPTPKADLQSLKIVLSLLSFLPDSALHWLLKKLQSADAMPAWSDILASQLRLLLFGLKGIVFTLYYSGQGDPYHSNTIYEVIGYQVSCSPKSNNKKEIINE